MRGLSFFPPLLTIILVLIPNTSAGESERYVLLRKKMVEDQILSRGVKDEAVLKAMLKVPRHEFVPALKKRFAYKDYPLSIGEGQTISQPYIVAFMTEALRLESDHRVLEIGTGSGYQAAILAELVKEVYTVEIIEKLGTRARQTLERLGYRNVFVRIGDGYGGWPEKAPFDAVIVTCASENIPKALVDQLKERGRMIIPVGRAGSVQKLVRGTKVNGTLLRREVMEVVFVPMVKGND
jgi:protein-L-isoaspartate(D-aspartate) O-methyltransferase